MIFARRAAVLALLTIGWGAAPGVAQETAPSVATREAVLTPQLIAPQEIEAFLLRGKVIATKGVSKGVTDARRVTLSDGRVTHDAQIQDVDIFKPIFEVGKNTEVNFRDTYRYNVAAYRLSRLLGLEEVPMSVLRRVDGKPAAVTWWVDDVAMDEGDRQKKQVVSPNPTRTASYFHILRVFDELIQNRDRNAGNLLWTKDWGMWMIDHTRAFRTGRELLKPELLDRCERTLFERMRGLTAAAVAETMGDTLLKVEIDALMARRDLLVKLFEDRIGQRGEAAVLYTMSR
jgi:hypothetical protein